VIEENHWWSGLNGIGKEGFYPGMSVSHFYCTNGRLNDTTNAGTPTMNFSVWDDMPDAQAVNFLRYDSDSPSRSIMAEAVLRLVDQSPDVLSIAEVGPGIGIDFGRFYSTLHVCGKIKFTVYEGSKKFADLFSDKYASVPVVNGTFADLLDSSFDIVVSRHVLEHQPTLEPSLTQQIRAARKLCAVAWFIPPQDEEVICLNEREQVHYNKYSRASVIEAFQREGFALSIYEGEWINAAGATEQYAVYIGLRN